MPDSAALARTAVLDLETLRAEDLLGALADLDWPVPYEDYAFLSTTMVDHVVGAGRETAARPELKVVVESKLSDIVTDLSVVGRLAVDLHRIRSSGRLPGYDPTVSRWADFLCRGGTDAREIANQARWYFPKPKGTVPRLKRWLRRCHSDASVMFLPSKGRFDVLNQNALAHEFFTDNRTCRIDISPNYRDWPAPAEPAPEVRETTAAMAEAFAKTVGLAIGNDPALMQSVQTLGRAVIERHLAKAWANLDRISSLITDRRAGATLVGGTPKHIGRLFAWQYQRLGRQVIRFAHGGERAFYDDYAWGLAELPYCDRYFCHSAAEARLIEQRRSEGRMAAAGQDSVEFTSRGSTKHKAMRARSRGKPPPQRNGTVMYVAGGYLGEALGDFPSRKPPDVLYFDWQVWLLRTLRKQGYRVVTKVHPKGILNEASLLRAFSDDIVTGYFNPEIHDADCYIFDFAGTAFFDALASNKGIVLIDMGVRPHDRNSFKDLSQRCELVTCVRDDRGRFRLNGDALGEAVERACSTHQWPESFFTTYFGS